MAAGTAAGALLFKPEVHAELLRRTSYFFSVLSLLPVLNEARWGSLRFNMKTAKGTRGAAEDKKGANPESPTTEEPDNEEKPGHQAPLGLPSILFLLLSALISNHDLFKSASKKSVGKFDLLVKGVKQASAATKPSSGYVGQGIVFVGTALAAPEAASALHGIVMLIALFALGALSGYQAAGRSKMLQLCSRMVMVLPIGLFAAGYSGVLVKSWKGLVSEKLTNTLPATLHAAGIVLANRKQGSSTLSFAALQFAGLTASLWSEMLGSGGPVFAKLWSQPSVSMLQDNETLAITIPSVLAVLWLLIFQLKDNMGMITLATVASALTMPQTLSRYWPFLASFIGYAPMDSEALLRLLSTFYASAVLTLFFCGGTLAILGITVMGHVLMKVHGLDFAYE